MKHIQGRLWEMRISGRSGIARAVYVTAIGKRVVIVRVFVKKTQQTRYREIELALRARPARVSSFVSNLHEPTGAQGPNSTMGACAHSRGPSIPAAHCPGTICGAIDRLSHPALLHRSSIPERRVSPPRPPRRPGVAAGHSPPEAAGFSRTKKFLSAPIARRRSRSLSLVS